MKMAEVFLGIGTNLGDREQNLRDALALINQQIGRVLASSSVYETEPWGFETDNSFLNMAVKVRTPLSPYCLLKETESIETILGRIRDKKHYISRIIDVDILFYGEDIIDEISLSIPHPRITERRFVLVPLNEIAPGFIHPVIKKTVSSLLLSCPDTGRVQLIRPA
jgi:2-amino-4-hydroxy-6-hydroxymethyldihydropteridine diphosphokinase